MADTAKSSHGQDDKNYYIISDYYMGGDVQAELDGTVVTGFTCLTTAQEEAPKMLGKPHRSHRSLGQGG